MFIQSVPAAMPTSANAAPQIRRQSGHPVRGSQRHLALFEVTPRLVAGSAFAFPRLAKAVAWLVLLAGGTASSLQGAVTAPTYWPGNGHSYEVVAVPEGITWTEARDAATARGGHLVTLNSAAENIFVHSLVAGDPVCWVTIGIAPNQSSSGPWIGLYQPPGSAEPAGGWSWVTGEPLDFTHWEVNRPNNLDGFEDYGHYFGVGLNNRSSTWNDLPNESSDLVSIVATNPRAYIIEYNNVPEPSTLAVLLASFLGLAVNRRRRS